MNKADWESSCQRKKKNVIKSKLKIWGSNTISLGAHLSTGNLTSISRSLSVCLSRCILCIQTTWRIYDYRDDLYKQRKIKHYMSQGTLFSRLRWIFAKCFFLREKEKKISRQTMKWKRIKNTSLCYRSAYELKPFFRIHFLFVETLWFLLFSHCHSIPLKWFQPFYMSESFWMCGAYSRSEWIKALQFDLIKMQI